MKLSNFSIPMVQEKYRQMKSDRLKAIPVNLLVVNCKKLLNTFGIPSFLNHNPWDCFYKMFI